MLENNSCDQCVVDCKNMSDDLFPSEIFPALQEPGVAVYFLPGKCVPSFVWWMQPALSQPFLSGPRATAQRSVYSTQGTIYQNINPLKSKP